MTSECLSELGSPFRAKNQHI